MDSNFVFVPVFAAVVTLCPMIIYLILPGSFLRNWALFSFCNEIFFYPSMFCVLISVALYPAIFVITVASFFLCVVLVTGLLSCVIVSSNLRHYCGILFPVCCTGHRSPFLCHCIQQSSSLLWHPFSCVLYWSQVSFLVSLYPAIFVITVASFFLCVVLVTGLLSCV